MNCSGARIPIAYCKPRCRRPSAWRRRPPKSRPCGPKTLGCTNKWKSKQNASPSCKRPSKPPNAPRTVKLLLSASKHKSARTAPKRPGRKHGHPGAFRHKPEQTDEHIEVQLCSCPHCGGAQFKDQHAIEQLIEDIPPVRPHVTRLTIYQGTCVGCGQSVRSKHPLQMSLAIGAAGVHLGPRALALAADLNKAKGLSMRKTCAVLRDCFGLQLSSGGLSQALDRLAAKVKPQYDALAAELRQAPALHSDETSWWVAGPGWWLWVFTTQLLTFYVVAQSRGRDLLSDILGKDFGGVLVSDCLAIYDDATALQQKSYAHHQ